MSHIWYFSISIFNILHSLSSFLLINEEFLAFKEFKLFTCEPLQAIESIDSDFYSWTYYLHRMFTIGPASTVVHSVGQLQSTDSVTVERLVVHLHQQRVTHHNQGSMKHRSLLHHCHHLNTQHKIGGKLLMTCCESSLDSDHHDQWEIEKLGIISCYGQ